MSRFFSRNFAGQKGVEWYIQSAERKNMSNQEYSIQQNYHSELKEMRVFQTSKHQRSSSLINWLYEKCERDFFSWKEKALSSNRKTYESINLTGKINIIIYKTSITRLKDKSSKKITITRTISEGIHKIKRCEMWYQKYKMWWRK